MSVNLHQLPREFLEKAVATDELVKENLHCVNAVLSQMTRAAESQRGPQDRTPFRAPSCVSKKKKVITSADVLFSTQKLVKSKKGHLKSSEEQKKSSSSCNGALSGPTGRTPQTITGPGTLYPLPPFNGPANDQGEQRFSNGRT